LLGEVAERPPVAEILVGEPVKVHGVLGGPTDRVRLDADALRAPVDDRLGEAGLGGDLSVGASVTP